MTSPILVISNAVIHSLDPTIEQATALAVDGAQILALGSDAEITEAFPTSPSINAHGCTLLPGLTDAHIHLQDYAQSLQLVNCETSTQTECLDRVAAKAKVTSPGEWILGHGWNQNAWADGYGTLRQLDNAAPVNPVYLTHKSLHSAWANSQALVRAGINRNTPDPLGGSIGRFPDSEPDGILFESAMGLVDSQIPETSLEAVVEAIRQAQPLLWKMGLTGVHDFDRRACFSALQILHELGELKLRTVKGIPLENLTDAIDLGLRTGFGDDMLRVGSVKLFADGALGPQTAAMFQAYENNPQNFGMLMLDVEGLVEYGQQAVKNGISMAVHAIGDRANHEVLNAYAQLRDFERSLPQKSEGFLRHSIEHVQVLHPDDIQRFTQLNIIASMQPLHATSDMLMADEHWGKRSAYAYAWREQLNHGSRLIFGSDAPVESPNPFWGLYAAVTRRRADGSPSPQGWYPEQRLSINEALQAYTTGPAYAAGMEIRLGRLSPGYLADLIVLKDDPFTCPPEAIAELHPLAVMVGGEWVFSEWE